MSELDIDGFLMMMADVIEVYARELTKLDPADRDDTLSMVLGAALNDAAVGEIDPAGLQVLYDALAARINRRVVEIEGVGGQEIAGRA